MSDPAEAPRIYSCDDHLDIYNVPPDLWSSRLSAKHREAGPRVVRQNDLDIWVAGDAVLGRSGVFPGSATQREGVPDDGYRASDPKLRMQDMERDGIHASIVYGPGALWGFPVSDLELKREVLRAWNDWAAEVFNAYLPDRLSALAFLPTRNPEEAIAELHRAIDLGHKGVLFRVHDVENFNALQDEWEPLWAAAEEAGVPFSFHIGGGGRIDLDVIEDTRLRPWKIPAFSSAVPLQLDEVLAVLVFAGILERHPGLKVVLAESGIGWLPYFVNRMDQQFEKHCPRHKGMIKTPPSELFRRQVWATFEEEPLGPQLIPLLGPENFMWACDYPHPDSTWPNSHAAIEESMGALGAEVIHKVTSENCQKLYGLP